MPNETPKCSMCQRERVIGSPIFHMDSYDYNPIQVLTGQAFGWYSGDDGEVCPECMEKTVRQR